MQMTASEAIWAWTLLVLGFGTFVWAIFNGAQGARLAFYSIASMMLMASALGFVLFTKQVNELSRDLGPTADTCAKRKGTLEAISFLGRARVVCVLPDGDLFEIYVPRKGE